ncbi:YggT family protein [Candidatus Kaiserbacteria bacterium]|nr:MAG: YggT family protein [Candidatus Kaiserbacteria bacterium]
MISESSRPLYRGAQIVWYAFSVVEGLLIIRFILKLLNANPEALFTSLIYSLSNIFVLPFLAVFKNMRVETSVFEWTTLLAMLVYWILTVALIRLFIMSKSVSSMEADQKLVE